MKSLKEILESNGLSADTAKASGASASVAEPEPEAEDVCGLCGGAGFVRRTVRLGHPDFGRAFACECTEDEDEEERLSRLRRYSNLGPLSRLSFDNLSERGRSPNARHQETFAAAVKAGRAFADDSAGWLVLTGPSGCGKTHLAAAVAGKCVERGRAALFMVAPDLLDHLRAAYQPGNDIGYDDLFEMLKNAPVLVLDDLGVQSSTAWAQEKLFQLINHRYNARMPTVFTTNLGLGDFDSRIRCRLGDPDLSQVHSLESGSGFEVAGLDVLDLPHLRAMSFKTFDPNLVEVTRRDEVRAIQNAHRQALAFAEDPEGWLVIAGETGRGKTRLAAGIANYCRESEVRVIFAVVPDLLDWLRVSFGPDNSATFDEQFEKVRTVPLLVLDDLGSQTSTPWAQEKLFQLLNYRYNAALPTVITTNATVGQLETRIRTRITDPEFSSILTMGEFDFFSKREVAPSRPTPAPRGRPPRRV
jgi:DNA replication protein DnaC